MEVVDKGSVKGRKGMKRENWVNILSHYEPFLSFRPPKHALFDDVKTFFLLPCHSLPVVIFKLELSWKFSPWNLLSSGEGCTTRFFFHSPGLLCAMLPSTNADNLSTLTSSIKVAFMPTFGAPDWEFAVKAVIALKTVTSICSNSITWLFCWIAFVDRNRVKWRTTRSARDFFL